MTDGDGFFLVCVFLIAALTCWAFGSEIRAMKKIRKWLNAEHERENIRIDEEARKRDNNDNRSW